MKLVESAKNLLRSESNAIGMLVADHRQVDVLFKQFEASTSKLKRVEIVTAICRALVIHADLEEQIFYPETRGVLKTAQQDMIDEAVVEHASLKQLILALKGKRPGDKLFEAHVTVLKEYVQHHVKEEEGEYFPLVEKTRLNLEDVGVKMLKLRQRLDKSMKAQVPRATVAVQLRSAKPVAKAAPKKAIKRGALKKT